ncbi:MAG: hypothetical protein EHM33_09195 [Chloroflexi bacterium]|nr:MAG: hypothetical protein EHM33_09195 [Chloroflexota bacterium]
MSDEKKKDPLHADSRRETFFLPPLKMILAFFDKETRQREKKQKDAEKQEKTVEKNVERLIEKLSEKEKDE